MAPRRGTPHILAVARGDEPADLVLAGGMIFSPGTREWLREDLAIADGVIAGWGPREAREVVDVSGAALTPGFIDAHMHLESTKLWVDEFVRAVLPRGTTAVASDPHEIANVFGVRGVAALAEAAAGLPFTFGICASSCVPASPFESPGAQIHAAEVRELLETRGALGVAEVMNYPGVVAGEAGLLDKIAAAGDRRVDGHAPGLSGPALDAYLAAGVESDHECTMLDEAQEKRRKGMWIFIRQGSASKNLADLIPTVLRYGTERIALCSDDREPDTILRDGHLDDCVRLAVAQGVPIEDALVLATSNPAQYHNLDHLGWLAPGYQADVLCFDSLDRLLPARVYQAGRLVAENGQVIAGAVAAAGSPDWMRGSVHLATRPVPEAFRLEPPAGGLARVIGIEPDTLTTRHLVLDVTDPATAVARIAVAERHLRTGRIGLGYVRGFGLARGAIASTVAHDAHNCMVVGELGPAGPAEVAVLDGKVIAEVPLPIGGLMSDRPAAAIAAAVEHLEHVAAAELGVTIGT